MELISPDQLVINDTSLAMLADVDEIAQRVNEGRPIPRDVMERIEEELLGERVYTSNAIEGNTLDHRETIAVLQGGRISDGRKREATEACNLRDAINLISQWIAPGTDRHNVLSFLSIHTEVLKEIKADEYVGRFRTQRVMIDGAKLQPPSEIQVEFLMEQLFENIRQFEKIHSSVHPVVLATWAHWAIARIHPFLDGNGRMSRLWQDYMLLRARYTCAIIKPEDRRDYLDALSLADEGNLNALIQLVSNRILNTFDKYMSALAEDSALDDFAIKVGNEIRLRSQQSRQMDYMRWSRHMKLLRRDFELCAGRLSKEHEALHIQVKPYELINQQQWENLRSGLSASRTWYFIVDFNVGGKHLSYIFFFGKHFSGELDTPEERSTPRSTLLISESQAGGADAQRLDQMSNCPISLREVFTVGDRIICKYVDTITRKERYGRNFTALDIAKNFIRDVLLQRLS